MEDDSRRVSCCVAADATGKKLVLASVQYPAKEGGARAHSFVFDSSGKCVFHSPDNLGIGVLADDLFDLNCFWDITGDGNPEKLVTFIRDEVGERVDSPLDEAFQIWTIKSTGPKLLLHVNYDAHHDACDEAVWIRPRLFWPSSQSAKQGIGQEAPTIVLRGWTEDPIVEFRWSSDRQCVETDEPGTPRWEVVLRKSP